LGIWEQREEGDEKRRSSIGIKVNPVAGTGGVKTRKITTLVVGVLTKTRCRGGGGGNEVTSPRWRKERDRDLVRGGDLLRPGGGP